MKAKNLLSPVLIIALLAFIAIGSTLLIKNKRNQLHQIRYQEANALLRDSKYAEALTILKAIYPKIKGETQTEILYQIGICYQKTGEITEAKKYWDKVLNSKYSFHHPEIYYEFAQQRLREANFEEAQFYYSQITEKFPSHSLAGNATLGPVDIYIAKREFEKARQYCEEIIENLDYSSKIREITIDKLGEININLLFSPLVTDISEIYSVKAGDSLFSISRKFNTTIALLVRANNLPNSVIKPGQKLKITINKFSILVHVDKQDLFLHYDDKSFKRYKIAVGAKETPTPLGTFEIREKIKDPTWYPAGGGVVPPHSAQNLLGSRWMGLWETGKKTGYGLHEAIEPSDISTYISNGCIRMVKSDLEEIYDIVTIGTGVIIQSKE
ncbi:MAG: L,D-transpeptidase family protein [Candidatus Omnitrophica bacterium]|nr:L,D-transpeptidase family protein [Candidatus Omnitrophota bacterium]MBU1047658.1 L,D-transpeptidase family protein [Candidatus Omnitrophota bacterium]MBU1630354.1 L,D-transpeptidase family protein [Candidatus Omnitrophota bacterium]MBU1767084.1 L,D-transpeptidase family protein [Candidatus Omnitrophota bacterium]MBU1888612.1 L,D-transpeptidase family protein [Candidatus Omnitrophota bacterium]